MPNGSQLPFSNANNFSNLSVQETDMNDKKETPVIRLYPIVRISPVQIYPANLLGVRLSAAPRP